MSPLAFLLSATVSFCVTFFPPAVSTPLTCFFFFPFTAPADMTGIGFLRAGAGFEARAGAPPAAGPSSFRTASLAAAAAVNFAISDCAAIQSSG